MDAKLREVSIEILQRCPNRCIHCSSLSDRDKSCTIPFEKVCAVVDDAKDLGAKLICISGGEPFLHPDIIRILQYVSEKGLACYVYSSGVCLADGACVPVPHDVLAAVQPYITKLIVNYETADPEKYDEIMGTRCDGLRVLDETVKEAIAQGILVEAHFVPMHINWKDAPEVIQKCRSLGIKRVSFLRLVMQGRAPENRQQTSLSEDEQRSFLESLKPFEKDNSIRLGIPFRGNSYQCACAAGSGKISIRYDGRVYPCESFKNDEPKGIVSAKPESIMELSFKEIFLNSEYLKEVRELIKAFKAKKVCESCVNQYYRMHRKK